MIPAEVSHRKELSPRLAVAVLLTAIAVWGGIFYWQSHERPVQAHIAAGNEYARLGDGQNAIREWQLATQIDPHSSFAWQLLGQSYYEARRWAPAREALQQVLRLSPDTPHLDSLLAVCDHNLGDGDAALGFARKALQHDPNDIPALEVAAAVQTQKGDAAEITRILRKLTELQPDKVDNFIALAQVLMGQNSVADVIPVLDHVVQLEPNNAEMYTLRGIARFYADGSVDGQRRCEDDLAHAMSLKPSIYACSLYLGRIYRRRGQLEMSARFLENATHLNPYKPDAFFDLAAVEERRGERTQADAARRRFQALARADESYHHLQKQCDVSPADFDINLKVGALALRREDYQMAGLYLDRAARLRPDDVRVAAALRQLAARKADGKVISLPSALAGGPKSMAPSGGN